LGARKLRTNGGGEGVNRRGVRGGEEREVGGGRESRE